MTVNSINQLTTLLNDVDLDARVLSAIANDAPNSTANGPGAGLVTTRAGATVKNVQKVIADIDTAIGDTISDAVAAATLDAENAASASAISETNSAASETNSAASETNSAASASAAAATAANLKQAKLGTDTTDDTPEALTTDSLAAGSTNQVILPNDSAYIFHGTIVAREQASDGTDCAAWKVEGLIRREGSAGTTVLVNSVTTIIDNTPAWDITLLADTTNGGLEIRATGAASTNIRWAATINTSEVTY